MAEGIVICGANGSGKTTLAAALAQALGYKHMDIEDYYFMESEIPYTKQRTREEVQQLLLKDMQTYKRFVFSAVNGDMGEEIGAMYRCAILLSAPLALRLARIRQRSYDTFGKRAEPGGDMYEQEQRFFDFVATRSMEKTEQWLGSLSCPVIEMDGTKEISENVKWLLSNGLPLSEHK